MNITNICDALILHFKLKKYDNNQAHPYKWYALQIKGFANIEDKGFIRLIFNKLLKRNVLDKIKRNKSTLYYFRPYKISPKMKIKKEIIVYFN